MYNPFTAKMKDHHSRFKKNDRLFDYTSDSKWYENASKKNKRHRIALRTEKKKNKKAMDKMGLTSNVNDWPKGV